MKQANNEAPQKVALATTHQTTVTATIKAKLQQSTALTIEDTQIPASSEQSTISLSPLTTQLAPTVAIPKIVSSTVPFLPPFTDAAASNSQIETDVWQRIRGGLVMRDQDSKLIARYEQWYGRQPEYFTRMTDRAQRYLYFIVEEVAKRGMPMEIALLPMIESAFNPGAYSTARASGIWQFIPSTGKHFGMEQNWWYDGRRDIISATNGALDYLEKLHTQFGAWDLALAAYNCGENCVMRAQTRNRKRHLPTHYASLKLPKETISYVPKLLAVKNIIANPQRFGLTLTDIPNKPYFAVVNTARHIDLELAAEMAGISVEDFTALNPAHNRPVILLEGKDTLLLPVDHVETFRANLERANQPLVSWQAYPAKKGEDLDELASRFGITADKLKSINSLARNIKVSSGQALLVPLNGEEAETEFTAFNTHIKPADQNLLNAVKHIVRRGDTLSSIARRYHVKLSNLKSWNQGVRILKPGQHILVAQRISTSSSRYIKRAVTTKKIKHLSSRV